MYISTRQQTTANYSPEWYQWRSLRSLGTWSVLGADTMAAICYRFRRKDRRLPRWSLIRRKCVRDDRAQRSFGVYTVDLSIVYYTNETNVREGTVHSGRRWKWIYFRRFEGVGRQLTVPAGEVTPLFLPHPRTCAPYRIFRRQGAVLPWRIWRREYHDACAGPPDATPQLVPECGNFRMKPVAVIRRIYSAP